MPYRKADDDDGLTPFERSFRRNTVRAGSQARARRARAKEREMALKGLSRDGALTIEDGGSPAPAKFKGSARAEDSGDDSAASRSRPGWDGSGKDSVRIRPAKGRTSVAVDRRAADQPRGAKRRTANRDAVQRIPPAKASDSPTYASQLDEGPAFFGGPRQSGSARRGTARHSAASSRPQASSPMDGARSPRRQRNEGGTPRSSGEQRDSGLAAVRRILSKVPPVDTEIARKVEQHRRRGFTDPLDKSSRENLDCFRFGIHRWREFAVLKYGKHKVFAKSPHGKRILYDVLHATAPEKDHHHAEVAPWVENMRRFRPTPPPKKTSTERIATLRRFLHGSEASPFRRRPQKKGAAKRKAAAKASQRKGKAAPVGKAISVAGDAERLAAEQVALETARSRTYEVTNGEAVDSLAFQELALQGGKKGGRRSGRGVIAFSDETHLGDVNGSAGDASAKKPGIWQEDRNVAALRGPLAPPGDDSHVESAATTPPPGTQGSSSSAPETPNPAPPYTPGVSRLISELRLDILAGRTEYDAEEALPELFQPNGSAAGSPELLPGGGRPRHTSSEDTTTIEHYVDILDNAKKAFGRRSTSQELDKELGASDEEHSDGKSFCRSPSEASAATGAATEDADSVSIKSFSSRSEQDEGANKARAMDGKRRGETLAA